jgi:hypothetical protein
MGWLPQPFGDLGPISDLFLIILAAVFVHGIVQVAMGQQVSKEVRS